MLVLGILLLLLLLLLILLSRLWLRVRQRPRGRRSPVLLLRSLILTVCRLMWWRSDCLLWLMLVLKLRRGRVAVRWWLLLLNRSARPRIRPSRGGSSAAQARRTFRVHEGARGGSSVFRGNRGQEFHGGGDWVNGGRCRVHRKCSLGPILRRELWLIAARLLPPSIRPDVRLSLIPTRHFVWRGSIVPASGFRVCWRGISGRFQGVGGVSVGRKVALRRWKRSRGGERGGGGRSAETSRRAVDFVVALRKWLGGVQFAKFVWQKKESGGREGGEEEKGRGRGTE